MPITDIITTYYNKDGSPQKPIVEKYIPKEHTLKVSRVEDGKINDKQGLRFESKERVHIYL